MNANLVRQKGEEICGLISKINQIVNIYQTKLFDDIELTGDQLTALDTKYTAMRSDLITLANNMPTVT